MALALRKAERRGVVSRKRQEGYIGARRALINVPQPKPWEFGEVLAYLDARYGVTAASERVSAWASTLKGSISADQATGANQPIQLPWSGVNYLWLPGVAGNYASTPDSAAISITGDIDIRVKMSVPSWSSLSAAFILNKYTSSGNYSYDFVILTTGTLRLRISTDGLAGSTAESTVATGFAAGTANWVRVTRAFSTGYVNFYTSNNGETWEQLGSANITTTAGAIYDGSTSLFLGEDGSNNAPLNGKIYRAQIYNGIDGTKAFDADFTAVAEGATSFTESSSNGATVTINSTGAKKAQIVGSPQILFDGVAHYLQASLALAQPLVLIPVFKAVAHVSAGFIAGSAPTPTNLQITQRNTTPEIDLFAGSALAPVTSDLAVGTYGVLSATFAGASSQIQINRGSPVTGNPGTDGLSVLSIGATSAPNGYANLQFKALAVLNSVPSPARLNQLIEAMARQHGISV